MNPYHQWCGHDNYKRWFIFFIICLILNFHILFFFYEFYIFFPNFSNIEIPFLSPNFSLKYFEYRTLKSLLLGQFSCWPFWQEIQNYFHILVSSFSKTHNKFGRPSFLYQTFQILVSKLFGSKTEKLTLKESQKGDCEHVRLRFHMDIFLII